MATNTVGIDKEVEVNRKENLRNHRLYWIGRRTQDIILSSVALVVLSPVMLATAIAIVVDDPSAGPVFSQERIGRNGKPFKFYKFRSMCPNAEAKLDDLLDQNEMMVLCSRSRTTPALPVWASLSARPASMSCPSCGTS